MRIWIVASTVLTLVGPACSGTSSTGDTAAETAGDPAGDVVADVTSDPVPDPDEEEPAGVACELGTIYPADGVIDPDAPVYSDSTWTQEEVEAAFAAARAENNAYYRGYLAAHKYPEVLECAFCACGCASMSISHLSAVDCFKDMHGFA